MKRKASIKQHKQPLDADAQDIDTLYGLEPVFEPGSVAGELCQFVTISCPYCGEDFATSVDLTNGSCTYIEDCQVCCQPIDVTIEVQANGALCGVHARRQD